MFAGFFGDDDQMIDDGEDGVKLSVWQIEKRFYWMLCFEGIWLKNLHA